MLFGAHSARIVAVQPVMIHATRMLDVIFQIDGETTARSARLGAEALPATLAVGDRVQVHLLMNVATQIEPEAS